MQPQPVGEPAAPKKRRRPALACIHCRRRKLRCDQQNPCNNCNRSKIADCIYPPKHPAAQAALKKSPRSETSHSTPQAPDAQTRPNHSIQPRQHPDGVQSGQRVLALSHDGLTPPVSSSSPSLSIHETQLRGLNSLCLNVPSASTPSKLSRTSQGFHKLPGPHFGNQSEWMNHTCLYTTVLRTLAKVQRETSDLKRTLTACKTLGRQINAQVSIKKNPMPIGTKVPDKATADRLLHAYLEIYEGPFRVLHIPSFRVAYDEYYSQPGSASIIFILQLQICMALGSITCEDSLAWKSAASQWLMEAQMWLHQSIVRTRQRLTFEHLQLACLICLYEASISGTDHVHYCWTQAGDLYRKAMCLGLHRDPDWEGTLSLRQAEMRRRLWVTILEVNLLLALQAGRPVMITASDYDTLPPSNLDDEELCDNLQREIDMQQRIDPHRPTATTMQLLLHASFDLRLKSTCKINNFANETSYGEVLQFHSHLSEAQSHIRKRNAELATYVENDDARITPYHMKIIEMLTSRFILALHLPGIGKSIKDPVFHFSRRVCFMTSLRFMETWEIGSSPRQQRGITSMPRLRLRLLLVNNQGFLRHIAIQAMFSILLELVTHKEEQQAHSDPLAVSDEEELVQNAVWIQNWAEDQIRAGSTDVRTYCFITSCIAYAQALGSKSETRNIDQVIADTALNCNNKCFELMSGVAARLDHFDQGTQSVVAGEMEMTSFGLADEESFADTMGSTEYDWTLSLDPFGQTDWNLIL